MRGFNFLTWLVVAVSAGIAAAHGPQIQITGESGKITTRRLILDGPYSSTLTPETRVYAMPLRENLGAWYSQPNGAQLANGSPEFLSGPGIAYGYGFDPATPAATPFAVGAKFQLAFSDGLKRWNGAAFVDVGAAEAEAFTGGNPNAPSGVARTSDAAPFASLPLPGGAGTTSFTPDGNEVHTTARFRLLGDGASPASAIPDGVYLLSLTLSISTGDKAPSDPFYFVLNKNAASSVGAAIASLNVAPAQVQVVVPEPSAGALGCVALASVAAWRSRRRRGDAAW